MASLVLGSTSAKMQSEVTKAMNQGADAAAPGVTGHAISEAAKAEGGPTKGNLLPWVMFSECRKLICNLRFYFRSDAVPAYQTT